MKVLMRFTLLILFVCVAGTVAAQRPFNDDYYLFESNKAVKINAMVQDATGFMWLGTDLGLYKFNGQGDLTAVYDTTHQPVTALYHSGGVVYVGYANGLLGKVGHDTVTRILVLNVAPHSPIVDICTTPAGVILMCTGEGLFGVANNFGYQLNLKRRDGQPATNCMAPAPYGGILVGTPHGVDRIRITGGQLNIITSGKDAGLPDDFVSVIRRINNTALTWIGTNNGIARLQLNSDDRPPVTIKYNGLWAWGEVTDILPLSGSHVWVSTNAGYLLDVSVQDSLQIKPYLFDGKKYTRLLHSKSGNIWCGTYQGLSSISADFAGIVAMPPGFSIYELSAMACDQQNNIWYSQNQKLCKTVPNDNAAPTVIGILPKPITCMHVDAQNSIWIGTSGAGIWRLANNSKPVQIEARDLLAGGNILSITSSNGHLWVADTTGISELAIMGNTASLVKRHKKATGFSSDHIYQVYADHSGNIWIATEGGGICMYNGASYKCWDSVSGFNSKVVYTITEDAGHNIWAGTLENGLFRYDGKVWHHFKKENGLQDMTISTVMANNTGQVVIVHAEGVDEWYPASSQFRHFNARTGPSIDSTSIATNCAARDTAGNVYIPSSKGFIFFKNIEAPLELKPAVHINKIGVFLKPVKYGQREFAHNQNHISFQYEGINFVNIEPLNFRYMLTGYNDTWLPSTNETISFPQLAPGTYTFRLQASLDKDFEEASEVTYAFEVKAPVWQRPWFIALMVALVVGSVYTYIKLRERNLKKVAQLKHERMLFEYEHLKSQINPHFLFNSLNTLTNLIEENQAHAIDYTVQLSALYRNILTYRNKDTILLSEECKLLTSYMHIQKRRFGNALQFHVNIPETTLETCSIVPLALQLLVENAIKHNVVTLSTPLVIHVSVTAENEIVVRNPTRPKVSKEPGAGLALVNIKKRYSLLTKRSVTFGIEDDVYVVKLPLL